MAAEGKIEIDGLPTPLSITEAAGRHVAHTPCGLFEDCQGAIDTMDIDWPNAPATWTPVRVKKCSTDSKAGNVRRVAIQVFSVKPASVVNGLDAS